MTNSIRGPAQYEYLLVVTKQQTLIEYFLSALYYWMHDTTVYARIPIKIKFCGHYTNNPGTASQSGVCNQYVLLLVSIQRLSHIWHHMHVLASPVWWGGLHGYMCGKTWSWDVESQF